MGHPCNNICYQKTKAEQPYQKGDLEMDYKNLIYETSDQLTTIILNRPRFLNALSFETLDELRDAMERASAMGMSAG